MILEEKWKGKNVEEELGEKLQNRELLGSLGDIISLRH
jgi:hypothetical protein